MVDIFSSIGHLLGLGGQNNQFAQGQPTLDPQSDYLMQLGFGGQGFNPQVANQVSPSQPPVTPGSPPDVVVTGRNTPTGMDGGIDLSGLTTGAFNRAPLEVTPQDIQAAYQQHKGMFGVKGTLRDIIGGLGDAFLMGAGRAPAYWNQRQAEKQGDLQRGFTGGDQGATDAIERLSAAGFPQQAAQLENQFENRKVQALRAKAYADQQRILAQGRMQTNIAKQIRGIADQATYDHIKDDLQTRLDAATDGSVKLPDKLEDAIKTVGQLDVSGNALLRNDVATARADEQARHNRATEAVGQQNAESNRIRANRPPRGSQPTVASVVAPILAKQARGEQLSADEQGVLAATGNTPEAHQKKASALDALRNRAGLPSQGATQGGGKLVFRNGKLVKQ